MKIINHAERLLVAALAGAGIAYYWMQTQRSIPHDASSTGAATPRDASDAARTPGRFANQPGEIPARGWWRIAQRAYAEMNNDRVLAVSAGVAFYGLLALFPAVTAFVSLYGLVFDRSTVFAHLDTMAALLPSEAIAIMHDQMTRIVSAGEGGLGLAFITGLGIALWSANAGVKAIFDALNVAYGEREKRGFLHLNALSLMTTIGLMVAALAAIGLIAVIPVILNWFFLGSALEGLLRFGRWPLMFVALMLTLAVLYRIGPSRADAKWRWVTPGAAFSAAVWLCFSLLFSWYAEQFAHYNATYGALGAAIAVLIWMWLTAAIILIGAEINAETERHTWRDTTVGAAKPVGMRGAQVADVKAAA